MTTIYLIRHAEAEGNLYRRVHGWYNALITDNGFRQIQALERRFRDVQIDAVYSSDLYRTMTTARAVYVPKGLPLNTDPGLREIGMGDWEDLTFGEVRHRHPQAMDLFNRTDPAWEVPNGENFFQLGERIEGAVRRIARRHDGQTIALFSHGMAIRQFIARVKSVPPEEWYAVPHGDNTAVTRLTWDGERFALELEQDNSHLSEEISTLARQAWWRKDKKMSADVNLWYRPADWAAEGELCLEKAALASGEPFDMEAFRARAEECLSHTPWGVTLALSGDRTVGLFLLDTEKYAGDGAGYIPFCCILPDCRRQGLAIQLIGQAVALCRPLGRDRLRMPCAPGDNAAQRFCQKYGFVKTGEAAGWDMMEKYIGYER